MQPEVEWAGASLRIKAGVGRIHKIRRHLNWCEIVALNDVGLLCRIICGMKRGYRRVHKVGLGWSFVAVILILDIPQRKSHRMCRPHCAGWALDPTVTVWSDRKTKVVLGPCWTLKGLTGHWQGEGGSEETFAIIHYGGITIMSPGLQWRRGLTILGLLWWDEPENILHERFQENSLFDYKQFLSRKMSHLTEDIYKPCSSCDGCDKCEDICWLTVSKVGSGL